MPEPLPHKGKGKKIAGIDLKWWLIGGGATVAVIYVMYRRSQSSAAATTTTTAVDPNIDPNTGLPYTSSGTYGDYSAASGVYPSQYGYTDQYGNLITQGTPAQVVTAPTTNAAWFQAAEAYLTTTLGYDQATTAAALGKYLAGAQLTNAQLGIVQTALASQGYPPVHVHDPVVIPPTGQTNQPPPTKKPIVPVGTHIGTHITTNHDSVPKIAQGAHTSSAIIIALNAATLAPYNVHNLPAGLKIHYPTSSAKGTFPYKPS